MCTEREERARKKVHDWMNAERKRERERERERDRDREREREKERSVPFIETKYHWLNGVYTWIVGANDGEKNDASQWANSVTLPTLAPASCARQQQKQRDRREEEREKEREVEANLNQLTFKGHLSAPLLPVALVSLFFSLSLSLSSHRNAPHRWNPGQRREVERGENIKVSSLACCKRHERPAHQHELLHQVSILVTSDSVNSDSLINPQWSSCVLRR